MRFLNFSGRVLGKCGDYLLQRLLEVLPLRSQCTGRRGNQNMFPLPTSREMLVASFPLLGDDEVAWLLCCVLSLNSLWGDDLFL